MRDAAQAITAKNFLDHLRRLHGGQHLALGVSGGADSMALMVLVAAARDVPGAPRFSVLTVDHGTRPTTKQETALVVAQAEKFGLPAHVISLDTPPPTTGVQQWARHRRYLAMAKACRDIGADALVLAHHKDDQAETLLMRLAKRSGADGLAGMAPAQTLLTAAGPLTIVRPLLDQSRADLRAVLTATSVPYCNDPSNHDRRYERVRWRQKLPQLARDGVSVEDLSQLASHYRQLRKATEALLSHWFAAHGGCTQAGFVRVSAAPFRALDRPLQARLLGQWLHRLGGGRYRPRQKKLALLLEKLAGHPHGAASLAGCLVRWRGDAILLGREPQMVKKLPPLPARQDWQLWDSRFEVKLAPEYHAQGLFVAALGADGLRHMRQAGWRNDDRVPAAYLHVLPAFFDNDGLRACPLLLPQAGFFARLSRDFTGLHGDNHTGRTGKAGAQGLY